MGPRISRTPPRLFPLSIPSPPSTRVAPLTTEIPPETTRGLVGAVLDQGRSRAIDLRDEDIAADRVLAPDAETTTGIRRVGGENDAESLIPRGPATPGATLPTTTICPGFT